MSEENNKQIDPNEAVNEPSNVDDGRGKWYILRTRNGYENTIKNDLEKMISNLNLQDQIFEVFVPTETVVEERKGVRKVIERRAYTGYVYIRMNMNYDTWRYVRNVTNVTGWVGADREPEAVPREEMEEVKKYSGAIVSNFNVGDEIVVTSGIWEGTKSTIKEVNENKREVTITAILFSNETSVTISFDEIKKI